MQTTETLSAKIVDGLPFKKRECWQYGSKLLPEITMLNIDKHATCQG